MRYAMILAAVVLAISTTAFGIIKPDTPLPGICRMSKTILLGRVEKVDASRGSITAELVEVLSGAAQTGKTICMDTQAMPELAAQAAVGSPVVAFIGVRGSSVHLADTWLAAEGTDPAALKLTNSMKLGLTFPGRTAALVPLVRQIKEGRYSLLDKVNHHTFVEGWRQIADLAVKASAMAVGEADGDGRPDLLVIVDGKAKVFLNIGSEGPFQEASQQLGLADATATGAAFADVNGDGKVGLLLDRLWVKSGVRFEPSNSGIDLAGKGAMGVALADVTGDGKPDAVAVLSNGTLHVFVNPGSTTEPWKCQTRQLWSTGEQPLAVHLAEWMELGKLSAMVIRPGGLMHYNLDERDGPPSNWNRLTGEPVPVDRGGKPTMFPVVGYMASAAMDFNGGDGRPELFMATESGGKGRDMGLVNRGFGAFRLNREGHLGLINKRGGVTGKVAALAFHADINPAWSASTTLAILEDGKLFRCDSWACNNRGHHIVPGTPTENDTPGAQCGRSITDLRPRRAQ